MDTDAVPPAWAKWSLDFDAVEREVFTLAHTRSMWDVIWALRTAPGVQQDGQVDGYLVRTYVSTVCSAIRREADDRRDTTSLVRCLRFLVANSERFSWSLFLSVYPDQEPEIDREHMAREAFLAYAPGGGEFIEKAVVEASICRVIDAAAPVKRYADEVIAHRGASMSLSTEIFSLHQIDHALDELGDVMKEYYGLRHPGTMLAVVTPILSRSWALAFQQPWFPEGSRLPVLPERP